MTINNDDTPARVTSVSDLLARYAAGERDFRWANLYGANLYDANLTGANLSWANLSWANLTGANLYDASLRGANLSWANLYDANLSGANLSWANLTGANLYDASLYDANLSGANLSDANLSGANLRGAKNPPTSHDFLAEVLRQAAGDDYAKRNVAGLVLISREWCWEQFGAIAQAHWTPELRAWIAATLAPWPELVTLARRYGVIERTAGEAESEGE